MITSDDLDLLATRARLDLNAESGTYGYSFCMRVSSNLPVYLQARAMRRGAGSVVQFFVSHVDRPQDARRVSRAYLLRKFGPPNRLD